MSTLTIKFGSGYDAPWFVADVLDLNEGRKDLLAFAGLTEESEASDGRKISELSLLEVQAQVATLAQGAWSSSPAPSGRYNRGPIGKSAPQSGNAPAQAAAQEEADPKEAIKAAIAEASNKDELKAVHKRFGAEAFDADLMDLMKARAAQL